MLRCIVSHVCVPMGKVDGICWSISSHLWYTSFCYCYDFLISFPKWSGDLFSVAFHFFLICKHKIKNIQLLNGDIIQYVGPEDKMLPKAECSIFSEVLTYHMLHESSGNNCFVIPSYVENQYLNYIVTKWTKLGQNYSGKIDLEWINFIPSLLLTLSK